MVDNTKHNQQHAQMDPLARKLYLLLDFQDAVLKQGVVPGECHYLHTGPDYDYRYEHLNYVCKNAAAVIMEGQTIDARGPPQSEAHGHGLDIVLVQ